MKSSGKKRWSLAIIAVLVLLGWSLFPGKPPVDKFDHGPGSLLRKRPTHLNTEHVEDWSLLLNGEKVADNHLLLWYGQEIFLTGHLQPNLASIPPGAKSYLVLSMKPVWSKKLHEDWDFGITEQRWEWQCHALTEDRIIESDQRIRRSEFPPGDYSVRIYLAVEDEDAGENTVDLLATATLAIVDRKL
ncbi:MAG: hypothetical protein KDA78_00825 [Planctomycetaceae bacterium]|nr:hypothetical protein [Planctomycetaceae bacterium]